MPYTSDTVLCRRCVSAEVDVAALREYLDQYVQTLPDALRAPEHTYRARLALCDACTHRVLFTCVLCGCYVQARAAKAALDCPIAGGKKWRETLAVGEE